MSRGLEIVRRLLLTALWFSVGAIAIISTYAGISEYAEDYYFLEIKNDEQARDYSEKLSEVNQLDNELDTKSTDPAYVANVLKEWLDEYYEERDKREKQMWLSIGLSIICPLVGFGLHKLINWIMVYKQVK